MTVRRKQQAVVALVVIVLALVSGCGARLSNEDRLNAIGAPGAVNGTVDGGTGTTDTGSGTIASGPLTTGKGTKGTTTTGTQTGPTGTTNTGTTTGPTTVTKGEPGGPQAGGPSCAATSKNNGGGTDKGVSATEIKVSNISDISGPVPGLFKSAEQAAYAFVAYFNAMNPNGVCGRQIKLLPKDSATDSGINRAKTQDACDDSFAIVGSMSAFDDGGAGPVRDCGIVDLSAINVTGQRQTNQGSFAANAASTKAIATSVPKYFVDHAGSAVKSAAFLYIDAGAAAQNAHADIPVYERVGWKFSYTAGLPVQNASTQGFKPYVQKMKDKHVQTVVWLGAYQEAAALAEAMSESDFKPKVFMLDPTGYNPGYLQQAGSSAEGTYLYDDAVPVDDTSNSEMALYAQWLQRTGVSDAPTYFGQYAWSAMRLFTDLLWKVGPKLTRSAMNAQIAKVRNWTANGLHASHDVGSKHSHGCNKMYRVVNGKFVSLTKGFICAPLMKP